MNTRTWPYGTTRRGEVKEASFRPPQIPDHVASAQIILDDQNEMHFCIGEAGDSTAKKGDHGTLTFTQGGPTGGYWKFQSDALMFGEWLKDRPPVVQALARKFPPGSHIHDHNGVKLWVVAYNEDGSLSVSETNPGENYRKAVATRKPVCPCCIAKL